MECRSLVTLSGFARRSALLCEFAPRFFNSYFHFYEGGSLSCDTLIVKVYETTCSFVESQVVSVDVKKDVFNVTVLFYVFDVTVLDMHVQSQHSNQHVFLFKEYTCDTNHDQNTK